MKTFLIEYYNKLFNLEDELNIFSILNIYLLAVRPPYRF